MKKFKVLALSILLLVCSILVFVPTTTSAAEPGGFYKGLMLGGVCFCPAATDYNCLCWVEPTEQLPQ